MCFFYQKSILESAGCDQEVLKYLDCQQRTDKSLMLIIILRKYYIRKLAYIVNEKPLCIYIFIISINSL